MRDPIFTQTQLSAEWDPMMSEAFLEVSHGDGLTYFSLNCKGE